MGEEAARESQSWSTPRSSTHVLWEAGLRKGKGEITIKCVTANRYSGILLMALKLPQPLGSTLDGSTATFGNTTVPGFNNPCL